MKTYKSFDLLIERTESAYRARVLNSPTGQAHMDFALPFSAAELDALGDLTPGMDLSSAPLTPESFGGRLFEAVFAAGVGDCLRRSLDAVERDESGLRLNLRLNDVPELAALPWEFLHDPFYDRFLALSERTPIVRYLELPAGEPTLEVTPPLHILALIADPNDYTPRLDVEREWGRLQSALQDLSASGSVALERLETATWSALQDRLRQEDVHVLHFVGHGAFDPDGQAGALLLENDQGQQIPVAAEKMAALLHNHRPLRLVLLNACEGAISSQMDPFSGVAQSLVRQGIPAVIAMQAEISDGAAITFSHKFYAALADSYPVDAALTEARMAVYADNDIEWATPVLFSRSTDNRLLAVARPELVQPLTLAHFEPETLPVPAGPFQMGTPAGPAVPPHETPQHEVDLPAFRMGKYPVTNEQYEEFIRQTGQLVPPQAGWAGNSPLPDQRQHPVSGVTFYDALAYCRWLSQQTGRAYTLPNEAQWEKAARGNDGRRYPWGDDWEEGRCHHGSEESAPVDAFPAQSVYGCYDLVGNVREWTTSLWGERSREPDPRYCYPWADDGRNDPSAGEHLRRVYRGGAAADDRDKLRCAARGSYAPDRAGPPHKRHGFRVVLAMEE